MVVGATHSLLVADPELSTASRLQLLLDGEGIRITHRVDSRALLQTLQTEEIDVIFIAQTLAEQEPELVRNLTQRFSDIPVVMMLPVATHAELARWVSAGAADFVRLPLDAGELLFTIKKLLLLSADVNRV